MEGKKVKLSFHASTTEQDALPTLAVLKFLIFLILAGIIQLLFLIPIYSTLPQSAFLTIVLVSFAAGPPPPSCLNNTPETGLRFTAFKNSDQRKAHQRIIIGETAKLHYEGRSFGEGNSMNDGSRYLLGLYDAEKETVNLYEATNIFRMQQKIKGKKSELPKHLDSKFEARRQLIEQFGSKKKKTQVRTAELNKVESSTLIAADQTEAAVKHSSAASHYVEPEKAKRTDVPTYNEAAEDVDDSYPIRSIIAEEDRSSLKKAIADLEVAHTDESALTALQNAKNWPSFVLDVVQNLSPTTDKKKKRHVFELCAYLTFLIRFHFIPVGVLSKGASADRVGIPDHLLNKFVLLYTELQEIDGKPTRKRPKLQKHLLFNTICVLSLKATNHEVLHVDKLIADLHSTQNEIFDHFKAIGATIVNNKKGDAFQQKRKAPEEEAEPASYTIRLSAPLKFPEVKKPIRAKKSL